jgi:hypothetical protein
MPGEFEIKSIGRGRPVMSTRALWRALSALVVLLAAIAAVRFRSNGDGDFKASAASRALAGLLPDVHVEGDLRSAINQLRDASGVDLQVDRTLVERKIRFDGDRVSLDLHGLTLGQALEYTLANVNPRLAYAGEGDRILIITNPELREEVRIYDLGDLVRSARATGYRLPIITRSNLSALPVIPDVADESDILIELCRRLTDCLDPDRWNRGGDQEPQVYGFAGKLIVRHSRRGHRKVESFLSILRRADEQRPEAADRADGTQAYNVRDLLAQEQKATGCNYREAIDAIVDSLESEVVPDSWEGMGGRSGAIWDMAGLLIIRQTPGNHLKVQAALRQFHNDIHKIQPRERRFFGW